MAVLEDSVHRLAAAIVVPVASVGFLVATSTDVADDSGLADCIEAKPHRSLLPLPVE